MAREIDSVTKYDIEAASDVAVAAEDSRSIAVPNGEVVGNSTRVVGISVVPFTVTVVLSAKTLVFPWITYTSDTCTPLHELIVVEKTAEYCYRCCLSILHLTFSHLGEEWILKCLA